MSINLQLFLKKQWSQENPIKTTNFPLLEHYAHGSRDLMKKHIVLQTKNLLGITHITYGLNPVRYWNSYLKVAGLTSQHLDFAGKRPVHTASMAYFQNLF